SRFTSTVASMAVLLTLRGRNALSPFRIAKLLSNPAGTRVSGLAADFWHFVQAERSLVPSERAILERILTYGPRSAGHAEEGELLLVVPRPGTISPWSSKATDIARNCGLAAISRVERGIAYRVVTCDGRSLAHDERATLLSNIHDRMTEAAFPSLNDAARLFKHFATRPLETIDLEQGGPAAIQRANAALGLALSGDEIDYIADHFRSAGRNPTDVELMMFAQANSEHCRHQ